MESLNRLVACMVDQVSDPRVKLALELCQDRFTEPPLGLHQICEAIGLLRPRGVPCFRTVQRWVKELGMPYAVGPSGKQRVYFLSEVVDWYQRSFPVVHVTREDEHRVRSALLGTSGRMRGDAYRAG